MRDIPDRNVIGSRQRSLDEVLKNTVWGAALPAEHLHRVLDSAQESRFAAGETVASCLEPVREWIGLIEGFVKMSVTAADGKQSTLTGVAPGVWFGEGSLLKRETRRYDVIAMRDSRVALIPLNTFEWLRHNSFPFNHYLQHLMNARLSLFIGMLEHDRLLSVNARVAQSLASLLDSDMYPGASSFIDLKQDEVGLLANVSRQRANVALHALQDLGLLRIEWGGVSVLDLEGMRALAVSET